MKNILSKIREKSKERGVALLLTLIILSIVLLSAMLIVDITVAQLRLSSDIGDSVKAIYAADSGVEWKLYQSIKDDAATSPIMLNGAQIAATSVPGNIKSIGSIGKVKRQLEVNY